MKTVTFCGHSSLPSEEADFVEKSLYAEIEKTILCGATDFLLGDYGQFDRMCAKVITSLKENYPHINRVLVIPYLNRPYDKSLYDSVEYPPLETVPKRFCILKRNEYMVQKSDVVLSYVKYEWGGAAKTLEYAQKKGKRIIKIQVDI